MELIRKARCPTAGWPKGKAGGDAALPKADSGADRLREDFGGNGAASRDLLSAVRSSLPGGLRMKPGAGLRQAGGDGIRERAAVLQGIARSFRFC